MGREETIVLVYLRGRLRNEQAAGNSRVFVERQEIFEAVESHRPSTATDHAADRKRVVRAIEALNKAGLLIGAAQGDRFEVSAAIEVILPVEKLRELLAWLRQESAAATDEKTDGTVGEAEEVLPDASGDDDAANVGAPTRENFEHLTFDTEQENPA